MDKQFIQWKRFIQDSNKGFTLIELLVALIVASLILGVSLKFIVDQRQLFAKDQIRTQVNQNLRSATDLVGNDIKQAGERLVGNTNFPVVQVVDGGSSSTPDELVLQRLVIDQTLPVCQTVSASQATIDVSFNTSPNPAISTCPFSDGNGNSYPDNLDQWKNARGCNKDRSNPSCIPRTTNTTNDGCVEQGGTDRECLWAYIYFPAVGTNPAKGEFFLYSFEDSYSSSPTKFRIYRAQSATAAKNTWQNTYTYTAPTAAAPNPTNPVLYLLEERRYRLRFNDPNPNNTNIPPSSSGDNVLQLILNRQDGISPNNIGKPIRLVNQLSNFKVQAIKSDGTAFISADNWQQLRSVGVTLTARNQSQEVLNVLNLSISEQFFPRNAASKN